MGEATAWLWAMLARVEACTLERYRASAPGLATPEKVSAVEALAAQVTEPLELPDFLESPLVRLLTGAEGDGSRSSALVLQGLLLEPLGVTLYRALAEGDRLPPEGRAIAETAAAASQCAWDSAAEALIALEPDAGARFDRFTAGSTPLLASLDGFGEALDRAFAEPFDLPFAELMGDYVADLLPVCTADLGFGRREVMVHLTSALMA